MFGLSVPFLVIVVILVVLRIAHEIYIWWSFRRLKKHIKEIESKS